MKVEEKLKKLGYTISNCNTVKIDCKWFNNAYIEIIIRRGGGNKEYWRNIKERVKDWNIKGIK